MLAKVISRIIFYFIVIAVVVLSLVAVFFHNIQYDHLIDYILSGMNRSDLYGIVTKKYFTEGKFELLKIISLIVSVLSLLMLFPLLKFRMSIITYIQGCIDRVFNLNRNFWRAVGNNSRIVNGLLFVSIAFILVRSIYYATTFYIQYDEAWNYNYFLHNNIFYSCIAYNNYPLHNLVCWVFINIFSANTFVLRLPSIIAGILTCLLVFVFIKKLFLSEWLALCSTILFSCLPISIFYMLYSRGVMFEMFFSILVCYFLFTWHEKKLTIRQLLFLSILNALGTYSMLSHVYFIGLSVITIFIYQMFQRERDQRLLFLYPLLSIGFSFLLLLPMIMGTGVSLGLSASVGNASYLVLHMWPYHCYSDFMSGGWFLFYAFIMINLIVLRLTNKGEFQLMIIGNLVLLASPFLIKISTGIFPPERSMAFLSIIPILTLAVLVTKFKIGIRYLMAFTIASVCILSYATHTHTKLNWSKELDRQVYHLSTALLSRASVPIHSTTSKFSYFVPGVQYYHLINKRTFTYTTSEIGSSRYANTADAACVISDSFSGTKHLIFSYDSMYVYFKQ